ncbi:hypothetical protein PISMIDRAFT_679852, partial [Pisolithus microcarpus 441]
HKRFTGTCNEEFRLACGTIKLRGVEALELMHALIGEMLVGHDLGVCCITPPLPSHRNGAHVDEPADEVEGCKLDVLYQCMQDLERKWRSEGIGNREDR